MEVELPHVLEALTDREQPCRGLACSRPYFCKMVSCAALSLWSDSLVAVWPQVPMQTRLGIPRDLTEKDVVRRMVRKEK